MWSSSKLKLSYKQNELQNLFSSFPRLCSSALLTIWLKPLLARSGDLQICPHSLPHYWHVGSACLPGKAFKRKMDFSHYRELDCIQCGHLQRTTSPHTCSTPQPKLWSEKLPKECRLTICQPDCCVCDLRIPVTSFPLTPQVQTRQYHLQNFESAKG